MKIKREIKALQFRINDSIFLITDDEGTRIHPNGSGDWHMAQIEMHLSASRALVYFTYANLQPRFWMGCDRIMVKPEKNGIFLGGYIGFTNPGEAEYWREALPFAFYEVKSLASVERDWMPRFLDTKDQDMVRLWHEYAQLNEWKSPIARFVEFRGPSNGGARGYTPHYLADTEWLLEMDKLDGSGKEYKVMTDAEFQMVKA